MLTKRTIIFLLITIIFYFLANQTQVGWIYIFSNLFLGFLIVAWLYTRTMLKTIEITRHIHQKDSTQTASKNKNELALPTFYEDDEIEITLNINNTNLLKPAFLVYGQEECPFAPPEERSLSFFIPSLFKNKKEPLQLKYQSSCYKRGWYTVSTVPLHSNGPFGIGKSKKNIDVPTEVLIYPQYHPLKRLQLFEKWSLAEKQTLQIGVGSEVIGTRDYRPGDSPRWIHWRSTARTGQLVVKEFSEDESLTLSVVLDLCQIDSNKNNDLSEDKFSPFETAIRLAATFAYYASWQKTPFKLLGSSETWSPPPMALSWWATLNYLAKVKNDGDEALADFLESLPPLPFVIVLISNPTSATIKALKLLEQHGSYILAIFITLDGQVPPSVEKIASNRLTISTVSPYNWNEVIEKL